MKVLICIGSSDDTANLELYPTTLHDGDLYYYGSLSSEPYVYSLVLF